MALNATEKVIVNEVMKEWRKTVKPLHGALTVDPAELYGSYYTYHTYAQEWVDAVININNYAEILEVGELENIRAEVDKRVSRAVEKSDHIWANLIESHNK